MSARDSVIINFGEKTECDFTPYTEIEKTPCRSGDNVSIKIYAKDMSDYSKLKLYEGSKLLSSGTIKSLRDTYEEGIVFNDSYNAKTTKPIQSIVSVTATTELVYYDGLNFNNAFSSGSRLPCISIGDICIDITSNNNPKKKLIGSVDIKYLYSMYYKEYLWLAPNVTKTTQYPFFLTYNNIRLETFNIQVDPLSVEKDVTLIIKNVANGASIPGGLITISGGGQVYNGVSNINGECDFKLFTNINYDVSVVATGYINTNNDYLNNDSFVIT